MYIVAARIEAQPGKATKTAAYVAESREVIAKVTGQTIWAWAVAAGDNVGTFALSCTASSMEAYLDSMKRLADSAAYQQLSARAAGMLVGPTRTVLASVEAATTSGDPKPIIVVDRATIATGRQGEAMQWSAGMLHRITELTGVGGVLAVGSAGDVKEVFWIGGVDEAEELDGLNAALSRDPGYVALRDSSAGFMVEGSGQRLILVRLP